MLADKGYDSEKAHTDARDILGSNVETVIPVRKIEPKSSRSAHEAVPKGWYRRKMYREFDTNAYVFRNLGETVNSMIKRKMGDTAYGKSLDSVTREIKITCLAHNIRLLIDSRLVRL